MGGVEFREEFCERDLRKSVPLVLGVGKLLLGCLNNRGWCPSRSSHAIICDACGRHLSEVLAIGHIFLSK